MAPRGGQRSVSAKEQLVGVHCFAQGFLCCLGLTECNHLPMSCVYQHYSKRSRAYVVISFEQSYVGAVYLANLRLWLTWAFLFIPNHDTIACHNEPVYLWNYPNRCLSSISQLSQVVVPPSQLVWISFLKLMRASLKYIVFVLFYIEYPSKRKANDHIIACLWTFFAVGV